jgi:hypothetical protein
MPADDAQKSFDVFISYSHTDAKWVRDWLIPRLKRAGVSVCVDEDSFDIGVPALINMEKAAESSRRSVVVLTPAWVASHWTKYESLLIQHEDPAGALPILLPVLLEPCDVPKRIKMLTRADFTGQKDKDAEFAKLLDAIRGKSRMSPVPEPPNKNASRAGGNIHRPSVVEFVARRDKQGNDIVAQLKEELAPHKQNLVALWGKGGVGKTTRDDRSLRGAHRVD